MKQRTSVLAAFSFLSGLAAATLVTVAWFLVYLSGLIDVGVHARVDDLKEMMLASRILTGLTVLPAVASLAFWLAARGGIREAQGGLTGVGLYRSGVLLSLAAVLFAFSGRWSVSSRIDHALSEAKLTARDLLARRPGQSVAPPARMPVQPMPAVAGWLGVEVETVDSESAKALRIDGGARIVRVVAGSPAAKAGLTEGAVIVEVNETPVRSDKRLTEEIRSRAPGTTVHLLVVSAESPGEMNTVELILGDARQAPSTDR